MTRTATTTRDHGGMRSAKIIPATMAPNSRRLAPALMLL
jgi:hypothetical protein